MDWGGLIGGGLVGGLIGGPMGASIGGLMGSGIDFGNLVPEQPEAQTSTTTNEPPAWMLPMLKDYANLMQVYMMPGGTSSGVYRTPTPYYPGQTYAGFTPEQLQGQQMALNAAGQIQGMIPDYMSAIQSTLPGLQNMAAGGGDNPYLSALNTAGNASNPYLGVLGSMSSPTANPWGNALAPYTSANNPYIGAIDTGMNTNPYANWVNQIGNNATYNPYSGVLNNFAGGTVNPYTGVIGNFAQGGVNPYSGAIENLINPSISPFAFTPTMQSILGGQINPYATQMGNTIAGQMGTQFSENVLPYIRNEAMSSGAYGSSRQALSEGMAAGRFGEALAGELGNLYGGMWESAQGRALEAGLGLGNLYETAQGRSLSAASTAAGLYETEAQRALQAATTGANLYESSADRALRAAMEGAGLYQQGQQLSLQAALGGGQMYSTEANRALQAALGAGNLYQGATDSAIRAILGGGTMYESAQDRALRAATETAGLYETQMDRALKAAIQGTSVYESEQDRALKAALGINTTYPAAMNTAMQAMTLPADIYSQIGGQQQAMQQQQINEAMARYYYDPQLEQLKAISPLLPGNYGGTSTTTTPVNSPSTGQQLLSAGMTGYGLYAAGIANPYWAAAIGLGSILL